MNLQMIEQSPLMLGAGELWPEATSGKFLSAIRDGNRSSEAFHRWLVQDYAFAKGLAAIQAVAVAKTPRLCADLMTSNLSSLTA